jgi:beta-N-acetylhexosaminidase
MALRAGIDLVLVSHRHDVQRASIEAVRAAVATGELPAERVRDAADQVMRVKARYLAGKPAAALALSATDLDVHQALRDRAYAASTTVVRDEAGLLPLRLAADDGLLVVHVLSRTITKAVDIPYRGAPLEDALRQRHTRVRSITLTPSARPQQVEDAVRAASEAALVVLVTLNAHRDRRQLQLARRLATLGRPLIGIAACDPYDARALPEILTYLATYEYSPPALQAAARVLAGAIRPRGVPPVTLS